MVRCLVRDSNEKMMQCKTIRITIKCTLFPVKISISQFVWLEAHQEERVWYKFITIRPGVGCAMTSGTNKTLM